MIKSLFLNELLRTLYEALFEKADIKSSLALKAPSVVTDVKLQLCFDFFLICSPLLDQTAGRRSRCHRTGYCITCFAVKDARAGEGSFSREPA